MLTVPITHSLFLPCPVTTSQVQNMDCTDVCTCLLTAQTAGWTRNCGIPTAEPLEGL